ncbi:alkaline phosphatase D [Sphingobium sp. AP50]|uniref:alkaline phosphatase D family protein n=1 Tax=Sphingobium sp. AP50 TaxID=1884369 RepID=UPI0008C82433|nr:alkaline phosphatase D family protein [Sphingobium sp. AP50]SEI66460.1 alkaline phosphatase D [Sphingobium sp. AP50]
MQASPWHRRAVLGAMAALGAAPLRLLATPFTAQTDPFALGVASGDPSRDGFVLWTRLVGPGAHPLQARSIPVRYEVADDEGFRHIVRSGEIQAHPEAAHSIHLELTGLRPGRSYHYRFHALGATSPIGRTATVPGRADRLRLALTSCQHWELGWFGAYRDMLAGDPDLIVQVGDYIYETSYPDQPRVREFGAPEPRDLDGYRARYALYRTDPDLQEAHRRVPWLVTWDDHEVLNDYADLANREGLPPDIFAARRTAAYQAYFEHMPIRPSLWRSMATPRLYRGVDWGELVSLSMLDTRQFRSSPPCAAPSMARNARLDHCAERLRPDRTMLGQAQETWLAQRLTGERRPWTLLAQGVFFAPLALDGTGEAVYSDQWDGYAAGRDRLLEQLTRPNVHNPVILSGDIHSFWLNDLHGADTKQPVATEIVTSALAAQSPPAGRFGDVRANNPHVRFNDLSHSGYVRIEIEPTRLAAQFRAVDPKSAQTMPTILQDIERHAM